VPPERERKRERKKGGRQDTIKASIIFSLSPDFNVSTTYLSNIASYYYSFILDSCP
jgi:hypothetical protein